MAATAKKRKQTRAEANPLAGAKPPVESVRLADTPKDAMPAEATLRKWANEIVKELGKGNKAVLTVGEKLDKRIADLGSDANVKRFVKDYLPFSRNHAYRFRRVWQTFGNAENIERYDVSALYALSEKNTEAARKAAMDRANAGEYVSHKQAKALIAASKGEGVAGKSKKAALALPLENYRLVVTSKDANVQQLTWLAFRDALFAALPEVEKRVKAEQMPNEE